MADGYYTEQVHGPHEYFDLGHLELASGFVLPEARLAYKTIGTLSAAKDNAILLPHMYTGTAAFMTSYIGPGRPLDPDKYFLILPPSSVPGSPPRPATRRRRSTAARSRRWPSPTTCAPSTSWSPSTSASASSRWSAAGPWAASRPWSGAPSRAGLRPHGPDRRDVPGRGLA